MGGRGSLGHSETRVGALTEGRCCPLSPPPPLPTLPAWNPCSAGDGEEGGRKGEGEGEGGLVPYWVTLGCISKEHTI